MLKKIVTAGTCFAALILVTNLPRVAAQDQPKKPALQVWEQGMERVSTRALFLDKMPGDPAFAFKGQIRIDYSAPAWEGKHEQPFDKDQTVFDKETLGKRIRLGKDFWVTLDTDVAMTVGGVKIEPGYYFLCLERSKDDKWSLILLDPIKVRAVKLDAFQADKTTGGTAVPLAHENVKDAKEQAPKLAIKLAMEKAAPTKGTLTLAWGPHRLTAAVLATL